MRIFVVSLLSSSSLFAQIQSPGTPVQPSQPILPVTSPQPTTITIPRSIGQPQFFPNAPTEPGRLTITPPRTLTPPSVASPMQNVPPGQGATDNPNRPHSNIKLPLKENKIHLEGGSIISRKQGDSWQLWSGVTLLKDLGRNQAEAEETVKAFRELRPTDWVYIGTGRSVVEYGLTNGEAFSPTYAPKQSQTIDIKTVRADAVRGAWVLRDDNSILLNFGPNREDAEQASAVVQRYGFNRLGTVGQPNPTFSFFYAQSGQTPTPASPFAAMQVTDQERNLARTGIDVPGVGFIGERIVINPAKVEHRKEKGEWIVVHGTDVIAKFGASEWSARDAVRLIQEMRFTEFCKFNSEITFFLINGLAPTKVPFSVQSSRYDVDALKVRPASNGAWGLYDTTGRQVFTTSSETEAKNLVKLLQHYRFDQSCQLGLSSRACMKFMAKAGR